VVSQESNYAQNPKEEAAPNAKEAQHASGSEPEATSVLQKSQSDEKSAEASTADSAPARATESSRSEMPESTQTQDTLPKQPVESSVESGKDVSSREEESASVLVESRRHTRRSFAVAAAAAVAGYSFYRFVEGSPREEMQPGPLRDVFKWNAALSQKVFRERGLAPTYPLSRAENLRVNGVYGLKMELVPESYRLQVVGVRNATNHPRFSQDVTAWQYQYIDAKSKEDPGHDTKTPPQSARTAEKMAPEPMVGQEKMKEERSGRMPRGREEAGMSRSTLPVGTSGLLLTMEDILQLPRHELVTQFKCIEGWSQIVHWAGVKMADFLEAFPPELHNVKEPKFVYMETPDGDYYTGYDIDVCRHPQTLLVTEMMGAPLTQYHGAPLRLHMPTKYGYKQIKRIGLIHYTNERPDDYWTKLGYDWYAGL
jgi:molybdopterin-dependent oxidoreductase-like protein protein